MSIFYGLSSESDLETQLVIKYMFIIIGFSAKMLNLGQATNKYNRQWPCLTVKKEIMGLYIPAIE